MSIFIKHLAQWSIPTFMETGVKALILGSAAYLLPKDDFGILTLAMLVFTFHPMLQFGITDGLILKLPGWYIKNDLDEIYLSLRVSLTYVLIINVTLILLAIVICFFFDLYGKMFALMLIYGLVTIPYQIYNHYLLFNRYTYDMEVALYARSLNVLLRLAVQLPLLWFYGIYGLALGELAIYLITCCFINHISKRHLLPYLDFQRVKKYVTYGVPVFFVSLVGIPSVTLEKTIGAYYFDLNGIANIGLLAFLGSLLFLITGQILSLFSQYGREYFVKTSDEGSSYWGYLGFLQVTLLAYLVIGSGYFWLLSAYIIPNYLSEYSTVINFFPLIYLVFLGRVIVSIYSSWMLVVGERAKIAITHLVFCITTLALVVISTMDNPLTLEILLRCLVFGILSQVIIIVAFAFLKSKQYESAPWLIILMVCLFIPPIMFSIFVDVGWFLFCALNVLILLLQYGLSYRNKYFESQFIMLKRIVTKSYL